MSVEHETICKTCKIQFWWAGLSAKKLPEDERRQWFHNATKNEHIKHDLLEWCSDYEEIGDDGHLRLSHMWTEPEIIVENYRDYAFVNLAEVD